MVTIFSFFKEMLENRNLGKTGMLESRNLGKTRILESRNLEKQESWKIGVLKNKNLENDYDYME